jgi:DNA mismatch repair ATPase MutS
VWVKSEKGEMEKVVHERNQIIESLIERSNLQQEEKSAITEQLKEKEIELAEAQKELVRMNKRLFMESMEKKRLRSETFDFDSVRKNWAWETPRSSLAICHAFCNH